MNFIRAREFFVYVVAACTVFACATGSTGNGGEGGEGGDDSWGGPSSSSKSASSGGGGGSSSSSGSGGPTVCDMKSTICSDCASCSRSAPDGLCVSQYNDCMANTECNDFALCIGDCQGDSACISNCESFYPSGVSIFDTYAQCVVCQDCYVACDGASATCN